MPEFPAVDLQTHRVLAGLSRVRVLEFLRAHDGGWSAPEVAEHVGLHANTVRLHLEQLVAANLVTREQEPRRGPGRPRLLYRAVTLAARAADEAAPQPPAARPAGDADGYRMLAGVLAAQLEKVSPEPAGAAAEAGRAWAHSRTDRAVPASPPSPEEAVQRLVAALDELGFAPVAPAADGDPIELLSCPFGQVAEQHTEVVCGVHLGLMQGLLDDLAAPVHIARLEPFVAPGVCRAHLTTVDPADPAISQDITAPPTEGLSR